MQMALLDFLSDVTDDSSGQQNAYFRNFRQNFCIPVANLTFLAIFNTLMH